MLYIIIMYGKRIKQLRKDAGLSQEDLALKVGVSRPNISFWENADFPPLEAIDRVCKVLGMDIWKFFLTDEAITKVIDIPRESITLFQQFSLLDPESRNDVMEIFQLILKKYVERSAHYRKGSSSEMRYAPPDGTAVRTHNNEYYTNYYTRDNVNISVEECLNRLAYFGFS
jgi:transcriptional regulator with XRE-family HTH domain